MSDYSQYQSTNNKYSFSKGPKSLYFGLGDEALLGVVLNVPQTDVDDEWGGTERIAMERIADEIARLQQVVHGPSNDDTAGLFKQMSGLVGTTVKPSSSITDPFIDMSVPHLKMGNITVSGATNTITIGSSTVIIDTALMTVTGTFSGAVSADTVTTRVLYLNPEEVSGNIVGNVYLTGSLIAPIVQAATLNVTGNLAVSGVGTFNQLCTSTVNTDLYPGVTNLLNIGDSSLAFKDLYMSGVIHGGSLSVPGHASIGTSHGVVTIGDYAGGSTLSVNSPAQFNNTVVLTQETFTKKLTPSTTAVYDLGSESYKFKDGHLSGDLMVGSVHIAAGTFSVTGLSTTSLQGGISIGTLPGSAVNIGGPSGASVGISGPTAFYNTAQFTQETYTKDVIPSTTATYNLGSTFQKYKNIYLSGTMETAGLSIVSGTFSILGSSTVAIQGNIVIGTQAGSNITIGGPSGVLASVSCPIEFYNSVYMAQETFMRDITPRSNNSHKIGSSSYGFKNLYMCDPSGGIHRCYIDAGLAWQVAP